MRKFSRLGALAVAAGVTAIALVGCSSASTTPSPTATDSSKGPAATLTISVGGNSQDIALMYAIKEGYFKDVNLTVNPTVLQNGAQLMPLLLNGQMQAGLSNVPNVAAAVTQGINVKFVAAAAYDAPAGKKSFDGIIVKSDSGINSFKDLVGKTVATPGVSGASSLLAFAAVTKAGGDPTGMKLVEMAQPDMVAAVQSGHVDAGVEVEPFVTVAKNAGLKVVGYPSSYALPDQLFTGWVMSQSYIDQNPTVVSRFASAINRANTAIAKDIAGDGTVAREVLAAHVTVAPAILDQITLPTFSGDALTPAKISNVLADVYKFKLLKGNLSAKQLIWSGK